MVTAHPDDEAMFFTPFLSYTLEQHSHVYVLCLSSGDAQGLGLVRRKELVNALHNVFGLNAKHIRLIDDPRLADGMQEHWPEHRVAAHVKDFVREFSLDLLVTFDERGVSGHPNHIACFQGVERVCEALPGLHGWCLESPGLLRKYSGPLDILTTWILNRCSWDKVFVTLDFLQSYRAMEAHASQFVWYRRLFVLFSRFSWVCSFRAIQCSVPVRDGRRD